ncbi:MAG: hypothetical protein ACLQFR_15240 [Streptosporangiaceae bacterium]
MTDRDDREHDGSSEDWLVELTDDEMAQLEVHGAIGEPRPESSRRRAMIER